jgi:hypothetical protein
MMNSTIRMQKKSALTWIKEVFSNYKRGVWLMSGYSMLLFVKKGGGTEYLLSGVCLFLCFVEDKCQVVYTAIEVALDIESALEEDVEHFTVSGEYFR